MNNFRPIEYTPTELEQLSENELVFPYSSTDATYLPKEHQYELTSAYFTERGINLTERIDGNDPEKIKHFLAYLRRKVYLYIYTHSHSTRDQLNFMIAKRGIANYPISAYRESFLEAMFIEGVYLLDNGDLASVTGVDLDTMQNMSADVMRNQDRDFHKDAIKLLQTLGLNYYGRYNFMAQGKGENW